MDKDKLRPDSQTDAVLDAILAAQNNVERVATICRLYKSLPAPYRTMVRETLPAITECLDAFSLEELRAIGVVACSEVVIQSTRADREGAEHG